MTVLIFNVLVAVLISLYEAQSPATSQQITSNWTPVYDNRTSSTYTNAVNSSNTFLIENVTDFIINSSVIANSVTTISVITENDNNSLVVDDSITKSSAIKESINNYSTFQESATKIVPIEHSTTNSSLKKNLITNSSVIEDSTTNYLDSNTSSSVINESTTNVLVIDNLTTNSSVTGDLTTNSSVIKDSIINSSVTNDYIANSSVIKDSTTNNSVIDDSINNASVIKDSTTNNSVIDDSINNDSVIKDYKTNNSVIEDSVNNAAAIETPDYAKIISSTTENPNVNESSTVNISASLLITTVSPENINILWNDSVINNVNTTMSINVSNIVDIKKTTEEKGIPENISVYNRTAVDNSLNTSEHEMTVIGLTTFLANLSDSFLETVTIANVSDMNETLLTTNVLDNIGLTNRTIPALNGFASLSNETMKNVDGINQTTLNTTIAPSSHPEDHTTQGYSNLDNKTSEAIQFHYVSTTIRFETSSTPILRLTTYTVEDVSSATVARKTTSNISSSSADSKTTPPVKQLPPPAIVSRIFEQKTPENPPPIIVPHNAFAPEPRLIARKLPPTKPTTLSPPPPPPIIIPPQAKSNIDRGPMHPLHRSQTPKTDPFDPQSRFPSRRESEKIDVQIDSLKSSTFDKLKPLTPITAALLPQTSSIASIGETDKQHKHVSDFSDQEFMGIQFFKPKTLMKDKQTHHPTPRKSFFDLQPLDKRFDMGSFVNLTSFSQVFFKPQPDIFRSNPINEQPLGNIRSVSDVTNTFKIGDKDMVSLGLKLDQSSKNFSEKRQMKLNSDTHPRTSSVTFGSNIPVEEKHVVETNAQSPSMPWDISSLNFNLNIPAMSTLKEVPTISLKEKQNIFSNINGSKDKIKNTPISTQTPVVSEVNQLQTGIKSDSTPVIARQDFSHFGFKVNSPITESEQKGMTIRKDASLNSNMQQIENVSASLKWNIPNLGVDWNVPAIRRSKLDKNSPDKPILEGLVLSRQIPRSPSQTNVIPDQGSNLNMSLPSPDASRVINGQVDSEILPVGVWNFMNTRRLQNAGQGLKSLSERGTDATKSTGIQKSKLASMPEFKPLHLSAPFSDETQSSSLDNVPVHYDNQDSFQGANNPMPDHVMSTKNSRNIIRKMKPIDWNISFMPTGMVSKSSWAKSSIVVNPLQNLGSNIFTQPQDRPISESINPMDKDVFSGQNTIHDMKPKTPAPLEPPPIFPYLTRGPTTLKPNTKGHSLVTSSPSRRGDDSHTVTGGICDSCVFVNEVCFVPHEVHCNQYYECVSQGGAVQVYKRECAVGLFFNRTNFLCGHPDMTDCSTDRCRQADVREYALEGHCTYHWSCRSSSEGSYPEIRCCPNNGAFREGEGCIEDSNCKESCSVDSMTNANNTKLQGCNLVKTDSPSTYLDTQANLVRPCALGTIFVESKCTCVQNATSERDTDKTGEGPCSANLKMTFPDPNSDSIADNSKNKQSVGVQNVAISKNGTALFYGAGKLTLWRFAHQMFGSILAIQLDFLNKQNEPRYQILLTNCNPNSKDGNPSIEIRLDTLYNEIIFEVDTYQARQQRMKLHYIAGTWNTVTFIYDGERAVGAVNRRARSLLLEGGIETRPSPLTIGGCHEVDSFRGEMDEIYVYEDCLPHNMISIFQSVLE